MSSMEEPVDIVVQDADGSTFSMIEFGGRRYPKYWNNREVFPSLSSLKARHDDVIIATFPKSGTTWCRTLVSELLRGPVNDSLNMRGFLEITTRDNLEKLESPRILFTHFTPDVISTDFSTKKCKIIFVVRNVKDATVSYYRHTRSAVGMYDGSLSAFLSMIIDKAVPYRSWFDHLRTWEKHFDSHPEIPVLIIHYENMIEDCLREVSRMRDFLGTAQDDDLCRQVVERCNFQNMQRRDAENPLIPRDRWVDNKSMFFRKGEVGDWKNWYTVSQSEQFDDIYTPEMQGSKFKFRYTL